MITRTKLWMIGIVLAGALMCQAQLQEVTLFTSGVGYFESMYEVEENVLHLEVPEDALNDVLKSLVVIGKDGAALHYMLYDADEPADRKLNDLQVPIGEEMGLLDLIRKLRGEKIKLEWGGDEISGTILGTEIRKEVVDDEQIVEVEYINLWVHDHFKRLALDEVDSVYLVDPDLQGDVTRALDVIANERNHDTETLQLKITKPSDELMVGYVQESPVWKMSYRLVLEEDTAVLVGTAHVDHPKGVDWEDIKLTLVSGQPVSFYQDLHTPVYVTRPEVQDVYSVSVVPEADAGGYALAEESQSRVLNQAAPRAMKAMGADSFAAFGDFANAAVEQVGSQISAETTGELFAFQIDDPVSLDAGKSAMIQVLAHRYEPERFSVFNASVHLKHPMNAGELDSGPYHLMPGPVTVYEDDIYAGDARVGNVSPGETRSISYSLDFNSQVLIENEPGVENIEKVIIADGIMTLHQSQKRTTHYRVKNTRGENREYRIEHPSTPGWTLAGKMGDVEKTDQHYRIPFEVKAKSQDTLTVVEDRDIKREIRLITLHEPQIINYLKMENMPKEAAAVLKTISERMAAQTALKQQLNDIRQTRGQITEDQNRLRENMRAVNRNSAGYARWEAKLLEQENELESLLEREENIQTELRKSESELRKRLNEFRTEG